VCTAIGASPEQLRVLSRREGVVDMRTDMHHEPAHRRAKRIGTLAERTSA
jgi:hypothetical protein